MHNLLMHRHKTQLTKNDTSIIATMNNDIQCILLYYNYIIILYTKKNLYYMAVHKGSPGTMTTEIVIHPAGNSV